MRQIVLRKECLEGVVQTLIELFFLVLISLYLRLLRVSGRDHAEVAASLQFNGSLPNECGVELSECIFPPLSGLSSEDLGTWHEVRIGEVTRRLGQGRCRHAWETKVYEALREDLLRIVLTRNVHEDIVAEVLRQVLIQAISDCFDSNLVMILWEVIKIYGNGKFRAELSDSLNQSA